MTDDEFLAAFEATTLPKFLWTHAAHVRLGYLYVSRLGLDAALIETRKRIGAYNVSKGNPTGYHETITAAFLTLIASRSLRGGWEAFANANPDLLQNSVLSRYYSREALFTPEARAGFVAPDREPLPQSI